MTTHTDGDDASTERAPGEVEYERRGREMVQELESFLRAELAYPRERRRISFLSARRDRSIDSGATVNPAKE
ncbi:MAG TPA: hypothetical protein VHX86_18055 [Tepidisphaeraceae bacterium]|jgi:hypothetical protein|nr:hypothetical protein [Tepidisphaeraceae bacterium]